MSSTDADLHQLAIRVGEALNAAGRRLATAESCTGGWVGKAVTDVSGSSDWYVGGVVAYDDAIKRSLLNVAAATLETHGAVSDAVVQEMARGALTALNADVAVAVSGIAGPTGGQPGKPVGTVWFGWAWRHGQAIHHRTRLKILDGDREAVRRKSVQTALSGLLEVVEAD